MAAKSKWGGRRDGAGRKPNPDKPRNVAVTKLPQRAPLAAIPAEPKPPQAIDAAALATALPQLEEMLKRHAVRRPTREQPRSPENSPFKLPWFPKKAIPTEGPVMAMDNLPVFADAGNAWINGGAFAAEGLVFLGYPYLAELAQRPEYRTMAETIADDATREWISFDVTGDDKQQAEERNKDPEGYEERMADPDEMKKRVKAAGKEDRVKELVDDQERLEVRDRFYWASTFDSWMGRSHFYLQIGDADFDRIDGEMAAPIGNSRDDMSKGKVSKDSPLKYIKTVEPVWTYPQAYNAINPLSPDWYNPQQWYVMGRNIHISRLPTFVTRPVPDMLKPAYAFGGLPLSQIAKPYVDIWLDTRQSVADMIKSFSVMVLQTDLAAQTAPGNATALLARVLLFNIMRDNQGLFVTNKNTEDFKNVSAPMSGLHELQAQAQEHMLSVARIPAVKFTGIQPAGLNASSDGEIKVYDDTIKAYQKRSFDPNLTRIINFQMLSLFGEVDPEITHRWNALRQLTDAEKAEQKKKEADWYGVLVDMGAFSPAEVRGVVINDPESPFAGLDPDDVPEPPAPEPGEGEAAPDDEEDAGGPEGPDAAGQGGGANDAAGPFLTGDEFVEADHPRAPDGKFSSGSSSGRTRSSGSEIAVEGSESGVAAVDRALSRIPATHRDSFPGRILVAKTMGRRADAVGMWEPHDRKITVSEGVQDFEEVVLHEMGHAYDDLGPRKNGLPPSAQVGRSFREAAKAMTPKEASRAKYWTQDRKEMFAEGYALAHAAEGTKATFFGGLTRERALQLFGAGVAAIREMGA